MVLARHEYFFSSPKILSKSYGYFLQANKVLGILDGPISFSNV
jgi:hypothetical protein